MPSDSGPGNPKKARESLDDDSDHKALEQSRSGNNECVTILSDDESSTTSVSDSSADRRDGVSDCSSDKDSKAKTEKPCLRVSPSIQLAPATPHKDTYNTVKNGISERQSSFRSTRNAWHFRNPKWTRSPNDPPNPQQAEDLAKNGKAAVTHTEKPGSLELFCGCARMTKELAAAGFDAVGVDYNRNKDKPESKAYVELDLSKEWGLLEVLKLVKDKKVKITFMAPPCGSASAAKAHQEKGWA